MTLFIVFVVLLVLSLVVAGFVIIPKLPLVAMVDVNNLPSEKEAIKKKQILSKRIEAEGLEVKKRWRERLKPVEDLWKYIQLAFRRYVGQVERLWYHEQNLKSKKNKLVVASLLDEKKIDQRINEGEQFLAQGRLDQAEEAFIAAIKLEKRSILAYKGLAETYTAKGSVPEAVETYKFLLHLDPKNDSFYSKLAELVDATGNTQEAIQYLEQAITINDSLSPRFYHLAELLLKIKQPETAKESILSAVALEPKNPKYLDLLLETGILCNDKELANKVYQELRLVNPDNQKLISFKERMQKM